MAEPNMVEMVVAALVSFNLDDQAPDYNETLRKAARAAIEALRVPTDAMIADGKEARDNLSGVIARSVWHNMILAALKG